MAPDIQHKGDDEGENEGEAQRAAEVMQRLEQLPRATPLCPFCVVLHAEPWPDYADEKLCAEHLPVFRALQCKGWNRERWHQHLAGLARHGRLPQQVDWWPPHQ